MKAPLAILLLPYAVDILLKLSTVALDKRMALQAVQSLSAGPKPSSAPNLTSDQQELIVNCIGFAALKTTTVLTTFVSAFAAVVIIRGSQASNLIWWLLIFSLLVAGFLLFWWVLPKPVYYASKKSLGNIDWMTIVVLAFCVYDAILAALSVLA